MARINISQILMKRGNTTAANTYVGPLGELVVDTGLRTVRVQDGVTAGGMSTLATNVQLQALGTYANATFGTSSYGNANVEAYIGANIGTLHTNAATQATSINAITANIGSFYTYANLNYGTSSYANANVIGYLASQNISSANIGAYQTFANSNAATQATSINSITANLGAYQNYGNLTFSTVANATSQAADITTLLSNAATQATSINTVNANLGAYQTYGNLTFSTVANAATQATSIATLQTQVYANANVAGYLAGNISVGNINATQYNFANGVNILSTVAGTYANANVAAYLPIYSGNVRAEYLIMSFGGIITTGASPAPSISGFSSISTAGNAVNEGNISASGNLVANRGAYITGNVTAGNINASQFNFANGVNILSTVGTYSNTNVASYLTTGVTTANLTVTGNVVQQSAYYETYGNISNSGGNLTCNFNLGTTFYAALTANVTANFTNVNAIASTVSGATIIVDQGATAYRVANVQVNGVNQTVRWVGAVAGVGTASNTDIMSFSLIHLGGAAYRVLGQISNYG